ncbi:MAG TPA: hypothetical protein VFC67_07960 [Prolixibacteraceae bacterium]|nr:hypothetical protein [Prolixibacteraceae bacterium]
MANIKIYVTYKDAVSNEIKNCCGSGDLEDFNEINCDKMGTDMAKVEAEINAGHKLVEIIDYRIEMTNDQ